MTVDASPEHELKMPYGLFCRLLLLAARHAELRALTPEVGEFWSAGEIADQTMELWPIALTDDEADLVVDWLRNYMATPTDWKHKQDMVRQCLDAMADEDLLRL